MNRADENLLDYMKYHIDSVDASKGPNYEKVKKFGQILIDNCEWCGACVAEEARASESRGERVGG
jgi:hypothetical protein